MVTGEIFYRPRSDGSQITGSFCDGPKCFAIFRYGPKQWGEWLPIQRHLCAPHVTGGEMDLVISAGEKCGFSAKIARLLKLKNWQCVTRLGDNEGDHQTVRFWQEDLARPSPKE